MWVQAANPMCPLLGHVRGLILPRSSAVTPADPFLGIFSIEKLFHANTLGPVLQMASVEQCVIVNRLVEQNPGMIPISPDNLPKLLDTCPLQHDSLTRTQRDRTARRNPCP